MSDAESPAPPSQTAPEDKLVFDYLRQRGYTNTEKVLLEEQTGAIENRYTAKDLVQALAVYAEKPSRPGENVLNDSAAVLQGVSDMGNPSNIQALLSNIGAVGAEDILSLDPTDKQDGFRQLEAWVDGSLDMYRPEFRPILFPIFIHFYLDLVQRGLKDAAIRFYTTFSSSFAPAHFATLDSIKGLLLPAHVQNNELAQRFRDEKYVIRMSRSGFGLLVGWLTEGVGGEAFGAGDGFTGEVGKRGRVSVMRVVNNHLRFDITSSNVTSVSPHSWEESTGLIGSLVPKTNGVVTSPKTFNAHHIVKLGPAPMNEELRNETQRVLREQALVDRDPAGQYEIPVGRPAVPGTTAPTPADLQRLPAPPTFRTVDVEREANSVRDARKRIRLEPSLLVNVDPTSPQAAQVRARALPSICTYTLHDAVDPAACSTFSEDTSLMAAGFSESYVRLWSLKGEKLRGLRSDFTSSSIKDYNSLRRIREKGGDATRKLIGHSGPVYSVAFDPLSGSAAPPKYLLSASADTTVRMWSMDTLTNIVAFRGHENPVWDVKWAPMGIYFATGSRDRTARLWSTDRVNCLRVYAGHLSDVDCVQFHPNSLYLATGSSDWTARLWDVPGGTCVRVFVGHQGAITALAMSPDGRLMATAGEDLAINLWDLGMGKRIKRMSGHTASIYSLAFSAESSLLVSGSADWTVRCWDVKSSGGVRSRPRENGTAAYPPMGLATGQASIATPQSYGEDENTETTDLVATFPTRRTPIVNVQFTPRNLVLTAGSYMGSTQ
ncbi:TFIID and SAGA subunit [Mycena kentingensis (nom. inval.)]|nr:TFIID and SAGA subunit [Mycena kentingensis (nom. inval.)]